MHVNARSHNASVVMNSDTEPNGKCPLESKWNSKKKSPKRKKNVESVQGLPLCALNQVVS